MSWLDTTPKIAAGSLDSTAANTATSQKPSQPPSTRLLLLQITVTLASPVNTHTPPFHMAHLSRPDLVLCHFAAFLDSPGTPVVELLTSVFSFIPNSYQSNHVLLVLNRRGMLL